jgi:L-asparaginase / beta-aspartyl-peptidase
VAYDISALMECADLPLKKAANKVVQSKLKNQEGWSGVIAIDKDGNVVTSFNCYGMKRGYLTSDGKIKVYAK